MCARRWGREGDMQERITGGRREEAQTKYEGIDVSPYPCK
jgi:hypothetical protein